MGSCAVGGGSNIMWKLNGDRLLVALYKVIRRFTFLQCCSRGWGGAMEIIKQ